MYVIFKPSLHCNLRCRYCYEQHAPNRCEMTDAELEQALRFLMALAKLRGDRRMTLCWHGGELFSVPLEKLIRGMALAEQLSAETGIKIKQSAQTNLTLATPAHADLVKRFLGGHIGVSLDVGSKCRLMANGEDAEPLITEKLDMMRSSGVHCGAITMITRQNLHDIPKIYEFFAQRRMCARLSRVFPLEYPFDASDEMFVTDEEFAQAEIEYFETWLADTGHYPDADIIRLLGDMLIGRPSTCARSGKCAGEHISVSPDGGLFSCAHFDATDKSIGNFKTDAPETVLANVRKFTTDHCRPPSSCSACRYFRICHGGCVSHLVNFGFPYECKADKIYWAHLERWLSRFGLGLYDLAGKSSEEIRRVLADILTRSSEG